LEKINFVEIFEQKLEFLGEIFNFSLFSPLFSPEITVFNKNRGIKQQISVNASEKDKKTKKSH